MKYEHKSAHRGYAIVPDREGWLLTTWSDLSGTITGAKAIIPYKCVPDIPKEANLHNKRGVITIGHWLYLYYKNHLVYSNLIILDQGEVRG